MKLRQAKSGRFIQQNGKPITFAILKKTCIAANAGYNDIIEHIPEELND